jgi:molecular chaperone DnaK
MEAEKKLRELQMISSKDNRQVEYYISTFKMVLELCPFLLSETQKSQMQDLVEKLQKAKEEQDLKDIQTYCQQAQVELENLLSSESRSSSSIQLILFTIEAIEIANHRDQTQANLMSSKLGQVLNAMERGNEDDANILLRELLPYVEHWVLQDREGSKIYTGIHS